MGNRTTRTLDGTTYTNVHDDNNKLTSASGGGLTASFGYDNNGNMTSVSGTMYPAKAVTYDDEDRMASITYGGVTDLYCYNYLGQRYRARLAGTYQRYLYDGERVLEDLNDSGAMLSRYTTTGGTYGDMLLGFQRSDGSVRYPVLDEAGSVRELVDGSAAVTDAYALDAFGRSMSVTGSTPNPYQFGGTWGYITDPSGLLQLGARFYWPELGRFVQQDPIGDGMNWYAYTENNPVTGVDPDGQVAIAIPLVAAACGTDVLVAGTVIVTGVASAAVSLFAPLHDCEKCPTQAKSKPKAKPRAKPKAPRRHRDYDKWKKRGCKPPPLNAKDAPNWGHDSYEVGNEIWHYDWKHGLPKGPHVGVYDKHTHKHKRDMPCKRVK